MTFADDKVRDEPDAPNELPFVVQYFSSKRHAEDIKSLGAAETELDNSEYAKLGNARPHKEFGIDASDAKIAKDAEHKVSKIGSASDVVKSPFASGTGYDKVPSIHFINKVSKIEARYTDGPTDTYPCRRCSMFIDSGKCTKVIGDIAPNGHCRFWDADETDPAMDSEFEESKYAKSSLAFNSPDEPEPDVNFPWSRGCLLSPRSKASGIGEEVGTIKPNGVSVLKHKGDPTGYASHRLVFTKNGQIIGAMQVTKTPSGKPHIANTFVHKNFRRTGIGTTLNSSAMKLYPGQEFERSEGPSEQGAAFREHLKKAHDEVPDKRPSWGTNGGYPKVNKEHTVRWLTVMSRDGETMYKDRSLPDTIENNGKQLETSMPLLHHERAEYEWMQTTVAEFVDEHGHEPDDEQRKQIYLDAHKKAGNVSERKWIEDNDYDWLSWEAWCRGEESRIENEKDDNPPPDPDVKPFDHSHDLESTIVGHWEKDEDEIDSEKEQAEIIGDEKFQIALDEQSVRDFDVDGRLHVAITHISKATVNPYLGHEIPGWEMLQLDPNKIYYLLRDPEELRKAAPTFNGIPVLNQHVPVSAQEHPKEAVIGSTGNDAVFNFPYLDNSLNIWPQEDIAGIENEKKKELSSAYRYTPDMTPGVYQGKKFDGRMTQLIGNHVALVAEGRAGPDVVVGDSKVNLEWAALERALIGLGHA